MPVTIEIHESRLHQTDAPRVKRESSGSSFFEHKPFMMFLLGVAVFCMGICFDPLLSWAGSTVAYEYDSASRLIRVSYSSGTEIRYTYDPAGNLVRREITGEEEAPTPTSTPIPVPTPTPTVTPAPAEPDHIVVSQGFGGTTANKLVRATDFSRITNFGALPSTFAEYLKTSRERSVNTAIADIDGDGITDIITAVGPGGLNSTQPSIVVAWSPFGGDDDGLKVITSKGVFDPEASNTFLRNPHGGLNVVAGDFVGDDLPMVVAAQGLGGTNQIRMLQYAEENGKRKLVPVGMFQGLTGPAASRNGSGGTAVAAGDVDGDDLDELVVGQMNGEGASTLFQVLDLEKVDGRVTVSKRTDPSYGMPDSYRGLGGVNLAVGDVNGDGREDILVGSAGMPDGANSNSALKSFIYAFEVSVDGSNTITGITPLTGISPIQVFTAEANPSGGVDVDTGNFDSDAADEILVSTQAIESLDLETGVVSISHTAPMNLVKGINLEFGSDNSFLRWSRAVQQFQAFAGAFAPSSGAVNISSYR